MSEKGKVVVKALVKGGAASGGPPIGPAVGPTGINIKDVVDAVNEQTMIFKGITVPVRIECDPETKQFEIYVETPSTASLILKELGVEVYSVSTDTHFTHKAWHDHSDAISKIEYIMIGDPSQKISRNFDVLDEESGLAQRGTFIIDPDGVVQAAEINADGIGRDASTLVGKVKAAQYVRNNPGEVCPAKWEEGAETLKPSLDLVGKI